MCERSPLYLSEAKSIIFDLLKRTLELFDLSLHLVEHYRLNKYLSEREQNRNYRHFSLHKPCKLNYNIISDLDIYLHHLYTSCRLTKSHLRSLHAARVKSSNDYIVIDDEIYDLSHLFKLKINKLWNQFQSTKIKTSDQTYQQILTSFRKISRFYQFLIKQLYGVHIVRDSHILQPIVISIIRLLLFIANKLKENLQIVSPTKINLNHFNIKQHEEICRVEEKKTVSQIKLIEVHPDDNHSLDFDEDEFYRLANLTRDN